METIVSEAAPVLAADRIEEDHELLISVAARLNRTSQMLLASLPVPLTFRQYRTLSRVIGGYTSLSQLAKRGNLSLPTVSENVDGLVKRGLMTTTASESDRRAIVLHATDAGREAAAAGQAVLKEFTKALLAELAPDRRADLQDSLRVVYEAATTYFVQNVQGR
ncbi:MarR family winged helix-turn-helix transcriptional regulator [Microbacterium immunditiarum]|uniref:DNA-binding MarR family transcriptional regulator n=1 Tax=Microbacterium immunditiarum TaxID=337480 RepID=A0A7Y9KIZ1_9MICO|nr:MarR family transcriptional regulator [Microbacterium immunditiarum]NYE19270.1 DNA-binding MarR family transcriptional regulator [Microbacterium immunditiarum]